MQRRLKEVRSLLDRQKRVESLLHRQEMPRHDLVETLVVKQHHSELTKKLDTMHPADIAYILEALPPEDRLLVWDLVRADRDGEILLEVSDAVRESLIDAMEPKELVAAVEQLDADELADLAPDLPTEVMQDVFSALDVEEREQLRSAMSYPDDSVGALMDFDMVTVREDVTLEVVLRYLRRFDELPDHTDQIFVVDREEKLRGVLSLSALLINDGEVEVAAVMREHPLVLHASDDAESAAQAFERYDLVSAPVIDHHDQLIGRLTVNEVMDFIREQSEEELLAQAGLREEEDIFAPIMDSVRNRWAWLAINLGTAFFASRVIGAFEGSIEKLVALAALMPIVAGIGGNSGNQTMTLIIRALAMGRITGRNLWQLVKRELFVTLMVGLCGSLVAALFAWAISHSISIALVMMAAMVCNMLVGASVGVLVPMVRARFGKDPAMGSSVLLTFATDSLGFFIFLGLATIFLL